MSTADFAGLNKGQLDFVTERTKQQLTLWAHDQLRQGWFHVTDDATLYLSFARSKGWVKKGADEMTAKGFGVAAAYLRR